MSSFRGSSQPKETQPVVLCSHVTAVFVQGTYVSLQHCTWLPALLEHQHTHEQTHTHICTDTVQTLLYHPLISAPPPLLCLMEIGLGLRVTYVLTIGDFVFSHLLLLSQLKPSSETDPLAHTHNDSRPLVLFFLQRKFLLLGLSFKCNMYSCSKGCLAVSMTRHWLIQS